MYCCKRQIQKIPTLQLLAKIDSKGCVEIRGEINTSLKKFVETWILNTSQDFKFNQGILEVFLKCGKDIEKQKAVVDRFISRFQERAGIQVNINWNI